MYDYRMYVCVFVVLSTCVIQRAFAFAMSNSTTPIDCELLIIHTRDVQCSFMRRESKHPNESPHWLTLSLLLNCLYSFSGSDTLVFFHNFFTTDSETKVLSNNHVMFCIHKSFSLPHPLCSTVGSNRLVFMYTNTRKV